MIPDQNNQYELNEMFHQGDYMTSCQWLERRFLHSQNRFMYLCNEQDDGEGCPKTTNRGVPTKCCLTDPYETGPIFGSDNNEQGEFGEK